MKDGTVVQCTITDLVNIWLNPSEVSEAEWGNLSYSTFVDWATTVTKNGVAEVLYYKGRPVIAFGHIRSLNYQDQRETWFIATQEFMTMGAKGMVFMRKYLRDMQDKYKGTKFVSITTSKHPRADRWFGLLGYGQPEQHDNVKVFVLGGDDHVQK